MNVLRSPLLCCIRFPREKGIYHKANLKKSLFPVQRMAIIVASREATKYFLLDIYIVLAIMDDVENVGEKKKNLQNTKEMYAFSSVKLTRAVNRNQNYS